MMKRLLAALLLVVLASPAVGQTVEGKEISELDAVVTPADDDLFVTDQDGSPEYRKITRAQIVAGVLALLQAHEALTGAHGITAYMETLLDDADAATARATLELGSAATSETGDFEASGAVAAHEADTTAVHGIADTSVLVVDSDLGTAAALDVPAAGDAAVGEVVKGSDTRLTDARTPTSHNHAGEDVTSGTVAGARLGLMVGDSGAGGSQGAVAAPSAGDAAANKFWHASGSWQQVIAGIGGSTGATDSTFLLSDGAGGSTVQPATGVTWDPSGSNSLGWLVVPNGTTIATQDGSPRAALYLAQTASGVTLLFQDSTVNSITAREGYVDLTAGNATTARVTSDQFRFASARLVGWTQSGQSATGTIDTGLVRHDAAVLRAVGSSSSTTGAFLSTTLVEANTATSGSPNVLAAIESGTCLNNTGATALNYNTLPAAAAGVGFCACVTDSDGMRFTAVGDDTIRDGSNVTGAAGYIESTQVGDCADFLALDSATWFIRNAYPSTHGWTTSAP